MISANNWCNQVALTCTGEFENEWLVPLPNSLSIFFLNEPATSQIVGDVGEFHSKRLKQIISSHKVALQIILICHFD